MTLKNIGLIGLGKMGSHIAERIMKSGQLIFVYDSKKEKIVELMEKGAYGCGSIKELAEKLEKPKVILFSVPAGKVIDEIIKQLDSHLSEGDTIIDLSNSFYKDSQRRAKKLGKRGIYVIDVGISGGIEGAKYGACLMIGGDESKVSELDCLFKIMSRSGSSYEYFGRSGSGHLVKGFHNLIEYGYLQSLAEGLESLHEISKKEGMTMSLKKICDIWSKGSIIESRIVSDAITAFQRSDLNKIDGSVYGETLEEMKKLIATGANSGVKLYSCKAAVKARMDSQKNPTCTGKIINAIRKVFGGHED